jgi:hypothetical protein
LGTIATEEVMPRRLPAGFKYRNRVDGPSGTGFVGVADQVTLLLTRGTSDRDRAFPLTVHAADDPTLELSATERRRGLAVDLGMDGVKTVYHDGWWTAPDEGSTKPNWQTGAMHSLTIHTNRRTYAIRAGADVSVDDLVTMARSVLVR